MRLAMISYFDIGESYELGDDVFDQERVAPGYDIGAVGIANPLGRGVVVDLLRKPSPLVQQWRAAAVQQISRPEMETGFDAGLGLSRTAFDERLEAVISGHPLVRCNLTIYAVGITLVCLEFGASVPVEFMRASADASSTRHTRPPSPRPFLTRRGTRREQQWRDWRRMAWWP